jgi:CubicO group peptidase (beta-lactamase class C family)
MVGASASMARAADSGWLTRRQAVLLAGAGLGGCALRPPAEDAALAAAVEALVQPLVQARLFSGAVVLARDGRLRVARGFGLANHALGLAFTPDTPCDAASLAKNFTAAGIWLLVHEGRLRPQQPVQALVPEYPHAAVTVWNLLTHSGGLAPDYGEFDRHFQPGQVRHTEALLTLAGREQPAPRFEPGSRFEYSDLGYDALALVIERVSGQPYAGFVRQRFLVPHGLEQAFARPARLADWPVPRTRGYRFREGRWQDDDAYDDEAFIGASNLQFSARDLARWSSAWAQARVLPAAAERAGSEVAVCAGQRSAVNALGWTALPAAAPAVASGAGGHNTGNYNGFRACVQWSRPRREVLAYVSNGGLPQRQGDALQAALAELLAGRPAGPIDLTAEAS